MARVLRSSLGDGVFHVTARGTGPTLIFLDDDDYHAFLRLLERVRSRQRWALHAYCLLGTHYTSSSRPGNARCRAGCRC